MTLHRACQRRKVCAFSFAAGNQNQLRVIRSQAFDGGQRSAHVGGFGVVEVVHTRMLRDPLAAMGQASERAQSLHQDRKSTRLNSSHVARSYAVFCLKKKAQAEHSTD